MTPVDWIIVVLTAFMAGWGYLQGLIVGALALMGFLGGGLAGSRLGPLLLEQGSRSPYAPLFALVGALTVGGVLAAGLEAVGFHLRGRMDRRLGVLDGAGGALLVAALGLGLVWLLGTVVLQTPGTRSLRPVVQRSAILQELNDRLPPSGPILKALARFDPFPRIDGPRARVRPPDAAIARDPDVRAAARSVVKVRGTACGLRVQGSGWVAGREIVVTNAHVVAGQDDTTAQVAGKGPRHEAEAIHYDPRNDLAVLRVPGLAGTPALRLNPDAGVGTSAAILGFPENGAYDVQAGRLGQTSTVLTQDAYGRGPVRRRLTSLRGRVRSGNSGGPMVDAQGYVVTTIFATAVSDGGGRGFGVPDSILADGLARARGPVDTGPCSR